VELKLAEVAEQGPTGMRALEVMERLMVILEVTDPTEQLVMMETLQQP
jgi:hypothetical protein